MSRIDFLDELATTVRANHWLNWEHRVSEEVGSKHGTYVEMTQLGVTRAVDQLLAGLEQQQTQSFYDAIELMDYEDHLALELWPDQLGP